MGRFTLKYLINNSIQFHLSSVIKESFLRSSIFSHSRANQIVKSSKCWPGNLSPKLLQSITNGYVWYERQTAAVQGDYISWLCEVDLPLCDFLGRSTACSWTVNKFTVIQTSTFTMPTHAWFHILVIIRKVPECWAEHLPERWWRRTSTCSILHHS